MLASVAVGACLAAATLAAALVLVACGACGEARRRARLALGAEAEGARARHAPGIFLASRGRSALFDEYT
jgi:hypothetical protein